MKRILYVFVAIALMLSLSLPATTVTSAAPSLLADPVTFTILHTNDFHGNLELSGSNPGAARVAQRSSMCAQLLAQTRSLSWTQAISCRARCSPTCKKVCRPSITISKLVTMLLPLATMSLIGVNLSWPNVLCRLLIAPYLVTPSQWWLPILSPKLAVPAMVGIARF